MLRRVVSGILMMGLAGATKCDEMRQLREEKSDLESVHEEVDPSGVYELACSGRVEEFHQIVKDSAPKFRADILGCAAAHNNMDLINYWKTPLSRDVDLADIDGDVDLANIHAGVDLCGVYELWNSGRVDEFDRSVKDLAPQFCADILGRAAADNNSDLVKHLLDLGVHPDHPVSNGHLPIVLALKAFEKNLMAKSVKALAIGGATLFLADPRLDTTALNVSNSLCEINCFAGGALFRWLTSTMRKQLQARRIPLKPVWQHRPPPAQTPEEQQRQFSNLVVCLDAVQDAIDKRDASVQSRIQ